MKKIFSFAILATFAVWLVVCFTSTKTDGESASSNDEEYVVTYRVHYSADSFKDYTYTFYAPNGVELQTSSWFGTNILYVIKTTRPVKYHTIIRTTAPVEIISYSDNFKKS